MAQNAADEHTPACAATADLPGLVPSAQVVASAARGAADPDFQRDRARSYPARLVLSAKARRPELLAAMTRAPIAPARQLLDVGCGPAAVSRLLLEASAGHVVGCDRDPEMVRLGRVDQPEGLDLHVLDAAGTALPWATGEFDVVWAGDVDVTAAIGELRRVLRPRGHLVLVSSGGHWQTYAFDTAFDLRVRLAEQRGLRRWRRPSNCSWQQQPHLTRGWTLVDSWTSVIERRQPVPPADISFRASDFALFSGGFLAEQADPHDWEALRSLWDARGPGWLFDRADTHLISGQLHQVWRRDATP